MNIINIWQMKYRKNTIIPLVVVLLIISLYYAFPLWYEWYLNYSQPVMIDTLVTSTPIATWSLEQDVDTGSIHDTSNDEYRKIVSLELPKLTKQTHALLDRYNQEPNSKDLFSLVDRLNDDGAYYTSIYLYQILLKQYPETAKYPVYLKLLLNRGEYTSQFLTQYQSTIDILSKSWYITSQDTLFYTSFRTLISGDVDSFYQTVHQLSWDYAAIAWDLITNLDTYSQYKQAPKQYLWWLFSSTLLRYGYYAPAIHLAQQSLKFNPSYILGIQILAYANIMTHNRDTAKSHLTVLMESDNQHLITYQRLYGIASYRDQEPKEAVRYLSQVQEKIPSIEMLRYLWLSYRSLYDYLHIAKTYRSLVSDYTPEAVDYFEFFDTYRRAVPYTQDMDLTTLTNPLDIYDSILLSDYVSSCEQNTDANLLYICQYWEALQSLYSQDTDTALSKMIWVARDHPYDFVFGMIGDLYLINWQAPTAQIYYQKAINSSYNWWYQVYLSNKIANLTIDG